MDQNLFVGVIGFEPIQTESPDLQSGPALQLRRTPIAIGPKFSDRSLFELLFCFSYERH